MNTLLHADIAQRECNRLLIGEVNVQIILSASTHTGGEQKMKIEWKRKLTSRKLWLAVAGLVSGLVVAFKGSAETAETVTGCIMSVASVVAYIVGEGLTDAASVKKDTEE